MYFGHLRLGHLGENNSVPQSPVFQVFFFIWITLAGIFGNFSSHFGIVGILVPICHVFSKLVGGTYRWEHPRPQYPRFQRFFFIRFEAKLPGFLTVLALPPPKSVWISFKNVWKTFQKRAWLLTKEVEKGSDIICAISVKNRLGKGRGGFVLLLDI